jgi:hypothetical protein
MAVAAAIAAWLGASLVVLSDGRRGLAAGVALATAGLAALAWLSAGPGAAALIAAGGAAAAVRRTRVGPPGWGIMPAGSTPRLVMCVAGGLLGLWVGAVVMPGDGAAARFAVMMAMALAGARALWSDDQPVLLSAVAVVALAIAVASSLAPASPGVWPAAAGAVVAAASAFTPARTPRAA